MSAEDTNSQNGSGIPDDGTPLGPYKGTPIRLFISDAPLLKQIMTVLGDLGFGQVSIIKVNPNYFQAMRQLYGDLRGFDGLCLVNQPLRKMTDPSGRQYEDHGFKDFFEGVASFFDKANRNPADHLSKCVPIFVAPQDQDIRSRYIEELFPFGIVGAFMLQVLDYHATYSEQIEERTNELHNYLLEYFQQKDKKLIELKEYKSASDLRERRAKAEEMMAEVEKLKEIQDFDKAIALCRQVIEVLPTDPEPYLESGRLLVKKKRYPPAMQMFNDASKVSVGSPTPHEEIGNLRIDQTRDYVEKQKNLGQEPDPEVIQGFLEDALESYGTALDKAKKIVTPGSGQQDEKRQDAVAGIVETMLSLDMGEVLGPDHPFFSKLGKLAHESLRGQIGGKGELPAKYLIQFGLSELNEGHFEQAEKLFFQASEQKDQFQSACTRLNYLGTVLRQRRLFDRAIKIYHQLIQLNPPFKGVVIFNLSVAYRAKADSLRDSDPKGAQKLDRDSIGFAVQALYVDPKLPQDQNFYQNSIMAEPLKVILKLFGTAAGNSAPSREQDEDPDSAACLEARQDLEKLLQEDQHREALGYLFNLAQTTQAFFLKFDKFASRPIQEFAASLEPKLRDNPKPQMRTFGKVLAVLVERGKNAQIPDPDSEDTGHNQLDLVMSYMMRGQQDMAAMAMANALFMEPDLMRDARLTGHQTLMNLCSEINGKLGNIKLERF